MSSSRKRSIPNSKRPGEVSVNLLWPRLIQLQGASSAMWVLKQNSVVITRSGGVKNPNMVVKCCVGRARPGIRVLSAAGDRRTRGTADQSDVKDREGKKDVRGCLRGGSVHCQTQEYKSWRRSRHQYAKEWLQL